jgi:hypothetical protein
MFENFITNRTVKWPLKENEMSETLQILYVDTPWCAVTAVFIIGHKFKVQGHFVPFSRWNSYCTPPRLIIKGPYPIRIVLRS